MNWDQNKELVEQILRTGMYAKLYDEETTYGYLTYLTYRVEDALFTWKKESDVDGFWADLTWEEYIAFLRREKSLVLAAQRVLLNTVIAFPASAFDFTLEEACLLYTSYTEHGLPSLSTKRQERSVPCWDRGRRSVSR